MSTLKSERDGDVGNRTAEILSEKLKGDCDELFPFTGADLQPIAGSTHQATREENDNGDEEQEEEEEEEEEEADNKSSLKNSDHQLIQEGYSNVKDKSLWIRVKFESRYLQWAELALNPVVSCLAPLLIIAFVLTTITHPEGAKERFLDWKAYVGGHFTWLYVGVLDFWAVFILIILLSKYSSIKLGGPDCVPEYNDATWFTMLFSCGVSTGLFFFGVAEPVLHYTTRNRYSADPSYTDNKLAQDAVNLTLYQWGFHAWLGYTLVGLQLSLMAYKNGLPMTIKSIFYPLIGDKIFGWPGDLVDILSVITTLFGVCISLGIGTIQINGGLNMLFSSYVPMSTHAQVIIIWAITFIAAISCVTGMKNGIRRLSEFCFACGLALMLFVLFTDETVFILNLYVQSVGYYFQWMLQVASHCDAFERLGPSFGAEERGRVILGENTNTDGPAQWMDMWTLFYWGWWVAWCPFVGMFIAKISRGRTIKEFIVGTMCGPTIYIIMWMIIFGGSGLRMEREAASHGICCHNMNLTHLQMMYFTNPDRMMAVSDEVCNGGGCNSCSVKMLTAMVENSQSLKSVVEEIEQQGTDNWGVTTSNRNLTRLSCRDVEDMWFDMMLSHGDLGPFLSGFSLLALILYFVTSMDSGSLVMDCLASNGHPDPPVLQRIAWACLEGITATALLVSGGKDSLSSLQTVSLVAGIGYLILICVSCVALWRALRVAGGDLKPHGNEFSIAILDPLMSDPFQEMFAAENWAETRCKLRLFPRLILNIVLAPHSVAKASGKVSGQATYVPYFLSLSVLLVVSITFFFMADAVAGIWALSLVFYIGFCALVAIVRTQAREYYNIPGSPLEDLFVSLILYPAVALQLVTTVEDEAYPLKGAASPDRRILEENKVLSAAAAAANNSVGSSNSCSTTGHVIIRMKERVKSVKSF